MNNPRGVYDEKGELIGIEIVDVSEFLGDGIAESVQARLLGMP